MPRAPTLHVELAEILLHEADEPHFVAHLADAHLLPREHGSSDAAPSREGMSRPLLKFGGGSVEILRDVRH